MSLTIGNLTCRTGIYCELDLRTEIGTFGFADLSVAGLSLLTTLDLSLDETTTLNIASDTRLSVQGIEDDAFSLRSLTIDRSLGTRVTIGEDGWRLESDVVDIDVDGLSDRDGVSLSTPLTLRDVRIGEDGTFFHSGFATSGGGMLTIRNTAIRTPGIEGELLLQHDDVRLSFDMSDGFGGLFGNFVVSHNLADGSGTLAAHDMMLAFDRRQLSEHAADWPFDWNVVAGSWACASGGGAYTSDPGGSHQCARQWFGLCKLVWL